VILFLLASKLTASNCCIVFTSVLRNPFPFEVFLWVDLTNEQQTPFPLGNRDNDESRRICFLWRTTKAPTQVLITTSPSARASDTAAESSPNLLMSFETIVPARTLWKVEAKLFSRHVSCTDTDATGNKGAFDS
jgi:hypothetical protein